MFVRFDPSLSGNYIDLFQGHDFGFSVNCDTLKEDNEMMDQAFVWCVDQFGLPGEYRDPEARWLTGSHLVFFRSEVDATAFRLRWC